MLHQLWPQSQYWHRSLSKLNWKNIPYWAKKWDQMNMGFLPYMNLWKVTAYLLFVCFGIPNLISWNRGLQFAHLYLFTQMMWSATIMGHFTLLPAWKWQFQPSRVMTNKNNGYRLGYSFQIFIYIYFFVLAELLISAIFSCGPIFVGLAVIFKSYCLYAFCSDC